MIAFLLLAAQAGLPAIFSNILIVVLHRDVNSNDYMFDINGKKHLVEVRGMVWRTCMCSDCEATDKAAEST